MRQANYDLTSVAYSSKNISHFPAVIRPMQQGLALFAPTIQVLWPAIIFYLGHVPLHRCPPFDLPLIVRVSSSHKVPTVPLKPSTGIVWVNPSFFPPNEKRLTGINSKKIQFGIMFLGTQLGVGKPIWWKFFFAIGHVFSAKYTQRKHLFWCQFRLEVWVKIFAHRFSQRINILFLHRIVDDNRY